MNKRTLQEVADFFDVRIECSRGEVFFLLSEYRITSDIGYLVEKPDTYFSVIVEPRSVEACIN